MAVSDAEEVLDWGEDEDEEDPESEFDKEGFDEEED